jgi:tetratricopeptide (TPR) repeat protein
MGDSHHMGNSRFLFEQKGEGLLKILSTKLFLSVSLCLMSSGTALASYQNSAFERGTAAMAHRDYDGAIMDFGEAVGFNCTDPRNYLMRGQCFFHTHNYQLAIQDFDKSLEFAPNDSQAYLWRGTAHASLGKDDFAVKDYEQAIRLDPKLADNFFNQQSSNEQVHGRGQVTTRNFRSQIVAAKGNYENKGLNENAIRDYKQAMALVYPDKSPRQAIGGSANSDIDNAAMPQTGRNRVRALQSNASADVHVDSENNVDVSSDDSLRAARNQRVVRSLDTDPNRGDFGPAPGTREFKGDAEKTVKSMSEAIDNDSSNPENYYRRAKAYQKLMNVGKAMTDYNAAILWGPNVSKYYLGRASLFHQLGKTSLVDADIERARRCDPDLPEKITFQGEPFPRSVQRSASVPDEN